MTLVTVQKTFCSSCLGTAPSICCLTVWQCIVAIRFTQASCFLKPKMITNTLIKCETNVTVCLLVFFNCDLFWLTEVMFCFFSSFFLPFFPSFFFTYERNTKFNVDFYFTDNFQDQMKRELSYREEMVQQLHIVRGEKNKANEKKKLTAEVFKDMCVIYTSAQFAPFCSFSRSCTLLQKFNLQIRSIASCLMAYLRYITLKAMIRPPTKNVNCFIIWSFKMSLNHLLLWITDIAYLWFSGAVCLCTIDCFSPSRSSRRFTPFFL